MSIKYAFSILAIILTFVAFVPYIRAIRQGETRPHVFSWVIWGSTTFTVFLAQLSDRGGIGAWPIGVSGVITLSIAYMAYQRRTDITITATDWAFLSAAALSLPLWFVTANALWAVIILTIVDALGFGPTFRKTYAAPMSESPLFYGLFVARNILVILALEHYSMTTILFPAVIAILSLALVVMICWRRLAMSG